MTPLVQIALGAFLLLLCTGVHIIAFAVIVVSLRRWNIDENHWVIRSELRKIAFVLLALLASHTVQIYIWAGMFYGVGVLETFETSVYFALVSYTTLGYGDVTLGPAFRIFGAMSSIVGVFCVGMSTAFLVGFFTRILAKAEE